MTKLFSEFSIKDVKLKNRIAVPPMVIGLAEDGYVTSGNIERYRELANGGAGLIIQEATCVNIDGRLMEKQLGIWKDEQIEGLKEIVNAVHEEGSKIFIQIHHAGVTSISENPICPSACEYKGPFRTVIGREMTTEDIKSIQKDFIEAAARAYKAGYDGIELHGCHGYLISQFLNKNVNKRTDEYGINPEKFVLEIINGIRNVTPKEFVIGIRLAGFEPALEDGLHYAKILDANGIDFLDVSFGFMSEQIVNIAEGYKYAHTVYAAEKIKEVVSVPVFAVNSIKSPALAEDILNETNVDIIDIGRGVLINPNWANDAKEGNDTGACLSCAKCKYFGQSQVCPGKVLFDRNKEQK
ncbi:NADH:flavin oxidoreductase [Clostridium sp. YIM B02505]|uniref:NADH:flavin oxidoreductase n=1 Tax=Clostridium yunnanense TaxID=2800325 RepID=A0ABS1ES05_9CLOT|nr:NADH:flavin oxidoreductase [Clostridium yunnanense]MBK1812132.1 NADH:flavin oxidoreductase [Clostridium yunnanense]